MEANVVLAVCEGGGNDGLAYFLVLCGVLGWAAVATVVIRKGENRRERLLLALVLAAAVVIGSIVFLVPEPSANDLVLRAIIGLVLSAATGLIAARVTGAMQPGRAFFVSLWGCILGPGGFVLLLIAAFAVGSGCIS